METCLECIAYMDSLKFYVNMLSLHPTLYIKFYFRTYEVERFLKVVSCRGIRKGQIAKY